MMEHLLEGIRENKLVDQVIIRPDSPVVGRTIGEIELRKRSGSTIVSIERDGRIINNPGAEEVIREGDLIAILGSPQERERAKRILSGGTEAHAISPSITRTSSPPARTESTTVRLNLRWASSIRSPTPM
jgi:uncharacterized protein with PhoU and TrkA domain